MLGATTEEMASGDEEEEAEPMLMIGGQRVYYGDVTEDMIQNMTPAEQEAYIKMGQELYTDMYD